MAFGQQGGEILISVAQLIDFGVAEFADLDRYRLAELIERILRQPARFIDTEPGSRGGNNVERGDLCRLAYKVANSFTFLFIKPVQVVDEEHGASVGREVRQEFAGGTLKSQFPTHRDPTLRCGPLGIEDNNRRLGTNHFREMFQQSRLTDPRIAAYFDVTLATVHSFANGCDSIMAGQHDVPDPIADVA